MPFGRGFLESAREDILQMDRNSETFLPDATRKLVSTALEKEFGEAFTREPAFLPMQARMIRYLLRDAESRSMIESFIDLVHGDGPTGPGS